jgi:hypothetical protein
MKLTVCNMPEFELDCKKKLNLVIVADGTKVLDKGEKIKITGITVHGELMNNTLFDKVKNIFKFKGE